MLTHIVAGDMRKRDIEMAIGRVGGDRADGRFARKGRGDAAPAPGTAEIESVQMDDFAATAVADAGGQQQGRRLMRSETGQEGAESALEVVRRQDAPHQLRHHERGGQELVLGRLPGLAVSIVRVPGQGDLAAEGGQVGVVGVSIVLGQTKGEGGVGVGPDPHRIVSQRQKGFEPFGET